MTSAAVPGRNRTLVRSRAIEDPGSLVALLPRHASLAWVRHGDGLVGWGEAARYEVRGPDRFVRAARWWRDQAALLDVEDAVGLPGSGPIAFGSFTFDDESAEASVLVVPRVIVGRRGRRTWMTTIGDGPVLRPADPPEAPRAVSYADGALAPDEWQKAVAEAVARIGAGELDKVVLARDVVARARRGIDARWLVDRLSRDYSGCWTFAVDGLVGATPELLVRLDKGLVTSRVLAGTIRRTGNDDHDLALAASLARSSKDLEEHEYAVRSVAEGLAPRCSSMNVPESPFVLHLPNVIHLATDLAGVLADGSSSLDLAAALHPTAAVCGTPTAAALRTLRELERMDRGRYAAPVGWIDARGDGEWGIALRSAAIERADPRRVRLFAGCGIVAGSDPAAELAECAAKLLPVREALGNAGPPDALDAHFPA